VTSPPSIPHCLSAFLLFESVDPSFTRQFISGRFTFSAANHKFQLSTTFPFDLVTKHSLKVIYEFSHLSEVSPPVTRCAGLQREGRLCYLHSILQREGQWK
jgi:hypothetical protein